MSTLYFLHYFYDDPITHIIVIDNIDSTVEASPITKEELERIKKQAERDAWSLKSYSIMINDYFFSYGPIPPWAQ